MSSCTGPITDFSSLFETPEPEEPAPSQIVIRTTAYCHHEAESHKYGKLTARGTTLRASGELRSAAADWSRYPVGTQFKILGSPQIYEIDDYGSALVGTDTIDIYQPTLSEMNAWGAPTVGIEIIKWGDLFESEKILAPRASKARHVREMLEGVRARIAEMPEEERLEYQRAQMLADAA